MPGTDIHTSSPESKVSSLQKPYIMQQEDDLRGLEKVMQLMRGISVLFLLLHFYWFCYGWFDTHGCTLGVLDRLLRNVQRTTGLFTYSYLTKLFAAGFLALSCWGTRSVRSERITHRQILLAAAAGLLLFFFGDPLRHLPPQWAAPLYVAATSIGFLLLFLAGLWLGRLVKERLREDPFNDENESFMQETRLIENEYSVNLRSRYYYGKTWHEGWINAVNPFRATIVLGTPGSGKSYTVVNSFIRQQIEKGFAMYLYDFKFDDLSSIAYNHLLNHLDAYETRPKFCIINFDDPRRSNRCNPIAPEFMTDISDAYESAYTIMLNLNKTWIQKQGDFFVDSPIILLAAIIWYLKIYEGGKYCTFPHAIELLCKRYEDIFTILTSYPELENYLSPFMDAWKGGAQDQLQGQIASAKIPLSRMISPQLYWVMTGNDFTLDINNPEDPKILCVGNNPDRQNIYSAALGLYNSRIVRLINKKGKLKSSIIIDELPTIYFRGLDNLIATARSNKVAVCLSFQDFSQLERDYGQEEAIAVFGHDPRIYKTTVKEFHKDKNGNLKELTIVSLESKKDEKTGRFMMVPVEGSEKKLPAELVLIAAGFLGTESYVAKAFGVELNARTNVSTQEGHYATNVKNVYVAGDNHRGQSLVVWAIREGREAAREVDESLMGYSYLSVQ